MNPTTESEWIKFLNEWNPKAYDVVLKLYIEEGFLPFIAKKQSKELPVYNCQGIEVPREICFGDGLQYPPATETEKLEVTRRLSFILKIIDKYHSIFERLQCNDGLSYFHSVVKQHGLGVVGKGASEKELVKFEQNYGLNLPENYRNFLKVTDGWLLSFYKILPVQKIMKFSERMKIDHSLEGLDEYFGNMGGYEFTEEALVVADFVSPAGKWLFYLQDDDKNWIFVDIKDDIRFESFNEIINTYYPITLEEQHWIHDE